MSIIQYRVFLLERNQRKIIPKLYCLLVIYNFMHYREQY